MIDILESHYGGSDILTAEQQQELVRIYRSSKDLSVRKECVDKLIGSLYKFIISIIGKYSFLIDKDTLKQAAFIGIIRGIRRYNSNGGALTTYLSCCIKTEVFRTIDREKNCVHVPERLHTEFRKFIRNEKNISKEKLCAYIRAMSPMFTIWEGRENKEDLVYDPNKDDSSIILDIMCVIDRGIARGKLKKRDKEVFSLYWGIDVPNKLTLREIGRRYNVSCECVRLWLNNVYKFLRSSMNVDGYDL